MNNFPLLQCFNINKNYKEGKIYTKILHNISFSMNKGEMVAIMGCSGSGKSTLLHLLGGLEKPTDGKIFFEGQQIHKLSQTKRAIILNQRLGFIFQFHHLLPDFTALENIAMPLLIKGIKIKQAQKEAKKMLISIGLEKYGHYFPSKLSGGERQRIAIARALINHPSLVLADEPTGNLDQFNTNSIIELIKKLNLLYKISFLIVTHNLKLAKCLHRQLEMHNGTLRNLK